LQVRFTIRPFCLRDLRVSAKNPYPAGRGNAVILPRMPANSRRVRWLSASSNQ
jgi:hypothetical protein